MGLNDNYVQARSQIMMMTPLLNQAYAMVIGDEAQKSVASSSSTGLLGAVPNSTNNHDYAVMYAKSGYQKFKKNQHLFCDFGKMKGHTKDVCYKLVGYPNNSRFKKKGEQGILLVISQDLQPTMFTQKDQEMCLIRHMSKKE